MSTPFFICALAKDFVIPEFNLLIEDAKGDGFEIKKAHDMNQLCELAENPDCFGAIFFEGFAADMVAGIQNMKFATDAKCVLVTKGNSNAKMLRLKALEAGAIAVFDPPIHRSQLLARARQLQKERPKPPPKVEAPEEEVKPQFRGIRYVFPKSDFRQSKPKWDDEVNAFRKRVEGAHLSTYEKEFHALLAYVAGTGDRVKFHLLSLCPRALSEGMPSKHYRRLTGSGDAIRGQVEPISKKVDLEATLIEGRSVLIPNMDLFRKENNLGAERDDIYKARANLLLVNSDGKLCGCISADYKTSAKGEDLELLETILRFSATFVDLFEEFDYLSRTYYGL